MIPVLISNGGEFGFLDEVTGRNPGGARDIIALFGALLAVTILAFVGAAIFRKRSGKTGLHRYPTVKAGLGAHEPGKHRFHFPWQRRHRRRQHRPRNPTLAETRGLPPIRKEESSPPPA